MNFDSVFTSEVANNIFFLDLMFLDMLNIHLSQLMQLLVRDALIYILFILL